MPSLAPLPGNDWTENERDQIDRLEALCRGSPHWELECRHTDAGDPWCIIYDHHEHRIILHIARIDRRYVVVGPAVQRSVAASTIERAIEAALAEIVSMT